MNVKILLGENVIELNQGKDLKPKHTYVRKF